MKKIILMLVLGLWAAASQAGRVQLDIHNSCNYDSVATQEEAAYAAGFSKTVPLQLGDHAVGFTSRSTGGGSTHGYAPAGVTYKGLPVDGLIDGGTFELGKGLVNKFGTATGDTKVNNTVARPYISGETTLSRSATVILEASDQKKYTNFNILVNGTRYSAPRTGIIMGANLEVKYVGDATWYSVWSELNVDITAAGTLGGTFGGPMPSTEPPWCSSAWTQIIASSNGYAKKSGSITAISAGNSYMYRLTTPVVLDGTKILESFRMTATTTEAARQNEFFLYAAIADAVASESCDLVFANTTPAQFIQKPFVTTNLSFAVRNDGTDATNVTVSVTGNYSWLTVESATNSIPLISGGGTAASVFNVIIASNAPGGVHSDAFTLNMQGTGTDGITSNFSAQVGLEVLNTAFSSITKASFVATTNSFDTAILTVSNDLPWDLSFNLTDSPAAAWLSYPSGTLTLPAYTSTGITVVADGRLAAGNGLYSTVLSATYLDNASTPNPKNFSLSFDVSPVISRLVNLTGDYNTGSVNINYVMPSLSTNGETLVYDNGLGVAIVTNGAVSAGGSYTGPSIYGSFRHGVTGGTAGAPPATPTIVRVESTDKLSFYAVNGNTVGESNLAANVDLMYVFKKADFIGGLNTGAVAFDAASSFSVTTSAYNANTKLLRAVVQNGNTWYISQASNTVASAATNPKIIVSNAYETLWAVWDPLASIDSSTLPDFSTTVAGSTFNDIQAVGFYCHLTRNAGTNGTTIQTGFSSIQIGGVAGGSGSSYTLTGGVTGGNGSVSPASVNVAVGASQSFSVAASNYYRIASLTANGTPVGIVFDNDSIATNFTWMNVQAAGALVATFTAQVASDPAGTPYWWLAQYGLTNFNAEAVDDQDKDGLSAWQEYIAGTDPTNIASSFRIVENPRNVLNWDAASGRIYSVFWSTNLLNGFQSLATDIAAPQSSYTNVTAVPHANYQIRVRMP